MRDTEQPAGVAASICHSDVKSPPITWSMTAAAKRDLPSDFEAMLLIIAAHDLGQPLQVIQNAYDILGLTARTAPELELLRISQIAINRLKEQLHQLQTAMRLRERTTGMNLEPLRVDRLLQRALRDNEDTAVKHSIVVRTVRTNASIVSDDLLLGAILRNLVSNAVKYTQPGGRILLGCRRCGADIRIDVYDTGIGISHEEAPRIFEAFVRLDALQRDGLGIGLFLVRQAIELLGHRIEFSSTPCRGSRFSIFAEHVGPR
jgi:two-component system phosphate regulon sensor histidine kinase PhoR